MAFRIGLARMLTPRRFNRAATRNTDKQHQLRMKQIENSFTLT